MVSLWIFQIFTLKSRYLQLDYILWFYQQKCLISPSTLPQPSYIYFPRPYPDLFTSFPPLPYPNPLTSISPDLIPTHLPHFPLSLILTLIDLFPPTLPRPIYLISPSTLPQPSYVYFPRPYPDLFTSFPPLPCPNPHRSISPYLTPTHLPYFPLYFTHYLISPYLIQTILRHFPPTLPQPQPFIIFPSTLPQPSYLVSPTSFPPLSSPSSNIYLRHLKIWQVIFTFCNVTILYALHCSLYQRKLLTNSGPYITLLQPSSAQYYSIIRSDFNRN